jgi:hypothetical protein
MCGEAPIGKRRERLSRPLGFVPPRCFRYHPVKIVREPAKLLRDIRRTLRELPQTVGDFREEL